MPIAITPTFSTYQSDGRKMRKRKRGYGQYEDEDTGEVTTVLTTKQVKRNHQKSGKWYKEPTEAEIRAWDREEQRQKAADKAAQREENKRINAAKRAEKEARESEVKKQLFEAGKITLTQTLAKKDEDQKNLHSWFGGRSRSLRVSNAEVKETPRKVDNESAFDSKQRSRVTDEPIFLHTAVIESASQQSDFDDVNEGDLQDLFESDLFSTAEPKMDTMADLKNPLDHPSMAQAVAENELAQSSQDFDIPVDSDAETEVLEAVIEPIQQDAAPTFKVPRLPASRLPLSPMSKSEVNIRNGNTTGTRGFKEKLQESQANVPPSTQAFVLGLSTQDLAVDLDDDLSSSEDKENESPEDEGSPSKRIRFSPSDETAKKKNVPQQNGSFTSATDSFYAKAFDDRHLGVNTHGDEEDDDNDNSFDDKDFESLPFTQLTSSLKAPPTVCKPHQTMSASIPQSVPYAPTERQPFGKCDSYPLPQGVSEDDLFEAFEQSQKETSASRPATPLETNTRLSLLLTNKRRRTLPWQQPERKVDGFAQEQDDNSDGSQGTELLSSSA